MVQDSVVIIRDFYCNPEDVAGNAHNQLSKLANEDGGEKTTGGGNMHTGSMQDSLQKNMAHKILNFPDYVDSLGNGCFTCEFEAHLEKWHNSDWAGCLFLGYMEDHDDVEGTNNDNNETTLQLVLQDGTIMLKRNTLVLFRSRSRVMIPSLENNDQKTPIFQLFFFDTFNSRFLAPDHHVVLDRLRQYRKIPGALSVKQCDEFIAIAEKWAEENNGGSWTTSRHKQYPTTDIPVPKLSFNEELKDIVRNKVFPVVSEQFLFPLDSLSFNDFFIVKYDAEAQAHLDWHRDISLISFNFCLNTDFEGGGTSFAHIESGPVRIEKGELIMHTGKLLHSGNATTKGIRYIIVGFIQVNTDRVDYDFVDRTSKTGISDQDLFRNLLLY